MDIHAIFQVLQKHPIYKNQAQNQADSIRAHILASATLPASPGRVEWSELSRRLRQDFPDVLTYLEQHRDDYKKYAQENILRRKAGYEFVCYGEELYPQGCYLMLDPPLTLSYRGHPAWLYGSSLAVVGSREPREETLLWMEKELSVAIEKFQLHVVSGGARGVDQKAHSLAIRKNLPTTVVLPSGLGCIYPQMLNDWIHPVLDAGGCFLSEYAFEQRMHKYLFHHRNRLIAALARVVLITEARQRSGTMITAQLGLDLSRSVLVVPGHPQDPHFSGSLSLIIDGGCSLVRDAQDLDIILSDELKNEKSYSVGVGQVQELKH